MKQIRTLRGFPAVSVLLAAAIIVVALGCGGSGGSGTTGTTTTGGSTGANPYAANYAGQFIDQNSFISNFSLTIGSDGTVNGSYGYTPPITFSGSVNSSGVGSITGSNGTFQVTLGASGKATLGGGIGTPSNGVFITLVSNPTGVYSGFSGLYAGTVHNLTLGKTGIIALSINSSGAVTGVDLFNVNGTPTLLPVAGTLSSSGQLNYVVNGVTVSGPVSLSGSTISGNVNESNGNTATISVNQVSPTG
jgi:hypothetical protein